MGDSWMLVTKVGEQNYWAPERWENNEFYGRRSEVWALSAIIFEIRTGSSLFNSSRGKKRLRDEMQKGDFTLQKDNYSLEFLHLMALTLVHDPNMRIKWEHFVEHPFFTVPELTMLSEL